MIFEQYKISGNYFVFLLFLVYEKHTDRIKERIHTHPGCEV